MGKSAKVHKRIQKKLKSSTSTPAASPPSSSRIQAAKKVFKLKEKAAYAKPHAAAAGFGSSQSQPGKILGGADYVSLLMGGRRKAKEEALKLPQTQSESSS